MRGLRAWAAATVLAVTVAACAPPPQTASPTSAPVRSFVRLDGFDLAAGTLLVTDAEFLSGDDATRAAQEAGDPWGAPNGFFIRLLATTRALQIDPDARITVNGNDAAGDYSLVPISVAVLVAALGGGASPEAMDSSPYWWIDVADGRIVAIEQQYLP
jgi:hypothetical protein